MLGVRVVGKRHAPTKTFVAEDVDDFLHTWFLRYNLFPPAVVIKRPDVGGDAVTVF